MEKNSKLWKTHFLTLQLTVDNQGLKTVSILACFLFYYGIKQTHKTI